MAQSKLKELFGRFFVFGVISASVTIVETKKFILKRIFRYDGADVVRSDN